MRKSSTITDTWAAEVFLPPWLWQWLYPQQWRISAAYLCAVLIWGKLWLVDLSLLSLIHFDKVPECTVKNNISCFYWHIFFAWLSADSAVTALHLHYSGWPCVYVCDHCVNWHSVEVGRFKAVLFTHFTIETLIQFVLQPINKLTVVMFCMKALDIMWQNSCVPAAQR